MRSLVAFNLKTFCKIPRPVWLVCGTLFQTVLLFKVFSLTTIEEYQQSAIFGAIAFVMLGIYVMRLKLESPRALYKFFKTYKHKDKDINRQIDKMVQHIKHHLASNNNKTMFEVQIGEDNLICEVQEHFDKEDLVITHKNGEQISSAISAYRMLFSYYLKQQVKTKNDILPVKEALIHIW